MKTVFLVFWGLCISWIAAAQSPHRPLSEFGTDTIRYMRANFEENKSRYIGRPLGLLLDDLDVKIVGFRVDYTIWDPGEVSGMINGLAVYYNLNIYWPPPCVYLLIVFEPPYTKSVRLCDDLENRYGRRWRPEFYDLFKDFVVKDILIVDPTTWPSWKGTSSSGGD